MFYFFFAKSYANFFSQSVHFTFQDSLKVSNVGVSLLQPGSLAANLYCSGQLYRDEGEAKRHHHNVAWFVSFFIGQCTWHKHLDNCYTKNLATYKHCLTLCALCLPHWTYLWLFTWLLPLKENIFQYKSFRLTQTFWSVHLKHSTCHLQISF